MEKRLTKLPNFLSIARIMSIPVLGLLAAANNRNWFAIVFLFGGLTDFLDGYIARKYNAVSRKGELLDSIADYLFYYSSILWIWWMEPRIREWWLLVLLAVIGIVLMEILKAWKQSFARHTWTAKCLSFLTFVLIFLLAIGAYSQFLIISYVAAAIVLELLSLRLL